MSQEWSERTFVSDCDECEFYVSTAATSFYSLEWGSGKCHSSHVSCHGHQIFIIRHDIQLSQVIFQMTFQTCDKNLFIPPAIPAQLTFNILLVHLKFSLSWLCLSNSFLCQQWCNRSSTYKRPLLSWKWWSRCSILWLRPWLAQKSWTTPVSLEITLRMPSHSTKASWTWL